MNIIVDNLHVKKEVYLLTAKKQLGAVHMEVLLDQAIFFQRHNRLFD